MAIHIKKIEIQWINKPNYSKPCPISSIKPDQSPQTILTYDFSHSYSLMTALRVKRLIKLIPPVKHTNTMQIEINIFRNIKILWEVGIFHNKFPKRKVNELWCILLCTFDDFIFILSVVWTEQCPQVSSIRKKLKPTKDQYFSISWI